jgi:hypothetical protein
MREKFPEGYAIIAQKGKIPDRDLRRMNIMMVKSATDRRKSDKDERPLANQRGCVMNHKNVVQDHADYCANRDIQPVLRKGQQKIDTVAELKKQRALKEKEKAEKRDITAVNAAAKKATTVANKAAREATTAVNKAAREATTAVNKAARKVTTAANKAAKANAQQETPLEKAKKALEKATKALENAERRVIEVPDVELPTACKSEKRKRGIAPEGVPIEGIAINRVAPEGVVVPVAELPPADREEVFWNKKDEELGDHFFPPPSPSENRKVKRRK